MIEVRGLWKSFGNVEVLQDINTTFKKGKVNQVIGK
ncbi:MAG TPA: ABC transporter ATP-binding protein, partial [Flavobacteriales bacterium]|nr:ABC transporter ATP-binding protein [Flavobacteriales bacterium]